MFSPTVVTFCHNLSVEQPSSQEVVGSGVTGWTSANGLACATGNTAESAAGIWDAKGWDDVGYDQDMAVRCMVRDIDLNDNGAAYCLFLIDGFWGAHTKYAGFLADSDGIADTGSAVSKDGTTEEKTDITANFGGMQGAAGFRAFMVIFTSGTSVKFYKNSTLAATHTTNIPPAADTTSDVRPWLFRALNNADEASTVCRGIFDIVKQIAV